MYQQAAGKGITLGISPDSPYTYLNPKTKQPYPWIVRSTAMVNHYYFYCVDEDFGPFFLKFCSYFGGDAVGHPASSGAV